MEKYVQPRLPSSFSPSVDQLASKCKRASGISGNSFTLPHHSALKHIDATNNTTM